MGLYKYGDGSAEEVESLEKWFCAGQQPGDGSPAVQLGKIRHLLDESFKTANRLKLLLFGARKRILEHFGCLNPNLVESGLGGQRHYTIA